MIQWSRQRLTSTTFSSLRIRGTYDFQKPRTEEREARFRIRRLIEPRSFLDPIVGQSTRMTAFRAWNCQPFIPARTRFIIKRVFYGSPPSPPLDDDRAPSNAFEECPSPSRKLSGLPITVKHALRPDGYRRTFFLFFFFLRTITEPKVFRSLD